jgi:hypothetical protein
VPIPTRRDVRRRAATIVAHMSDETSRSATRRQARITATAGGRVSLGDLRAYASARPGSRGVRALRAALDMPHVRSHGERRLLARLRAAGLRPQAEVRVGRLTVDLLFADLRLAVELDHEQTHGSAFAGPP